MEQAIFPLVVHPAELPVLRLALMVFADDLGHEEHRIRTVARELSARVAGDDARELDLDAADMKVAWSALHTLLDDSVRGQRADREHLHALLDRMPGEHDIRAIDLDAELARRG
jgi:hypothetical protein